MKRVSLLEMAALVLSRALHPFPKPVRTLDALHLASADFLRSRVEPISIASYDGRLIEAAELMGFSLAEI